MFTMPSPFFLAARSKHSVLFCAHSPNLIDGAMHCFFSWSTVCVSVCRQQFLLCVQWYCYLNAPLVRKILFKMINLSGMNRVFARINKHIYYLYKCKQKILKQIEEIEWQREIKEKHTEHSQARYARVQTHTQTRRLRSETNIMNGNEIKSSENGIQCISICTIIHVCTHGLTGYYSRH